MPDAEGLGRASHARPTATKGATPMPRSRHGGCATARHSRGGYVLRHHRSQPTPCPHAPPCRTGVYELPLLSLPSQQTPAAAVVPRDSGTLRAAAVLTEHHRPRTSPAECRSLYAA